MERLEHKKELPLGAGEEFIKEYRKETLPMVEVENTVIEVNPAFRGTLPFKVEKGKSTPLGVFFAAQLPSGKFLPETNRRGIISPEYSKGRSVLLGSVIFEDNEGRTYRDIDVKGVGLFKRIGRGYAPGPVQPMQGREGINNPYEAEGLMDYGRALRDKKYSELFIKNGIRAHRVIALLALDEIIGADGKVITVEQAKERGIIPPQMIPVAQIRAFGTKERVDYLEGWEGDPRSFAALEDARRMVAQEFGKDEKEFSPKDYMVWFAKTLGQNMAKIRKLKLHHGYVTTHNVTLDCRIVDLDSVAPTKQKVADRDADLENELGGELTEEKLYKDDFHYALSHVLNFFKNIPIGKDYFSRPKIELIFRNAYKEELSSRQKKKKRKE